MSTSIRKSRFVSMKYRLQMVTLLLVLAFLGTGETGEARRSQSPDKNITGAKGKRPQEASKRKPHRRYQRQARKKKTGRYVQLDQ
ncbi:MAG: hypothetical protein K2W95_04310 [Candidatus Obscuribacterales bacterium]|nr:hypothetical protein [Candidatus Obscuribacterales bacterium]